MRHIRTALRTVLVGWFLFLLTGLNAQDNISDAKSRPLGSVVKVTGVVTTGDELGDVRYMQDDAAGIAAFPNGSTPGIFYQFKPGDSVTVTGVLTDYRGLIEVSPVLDATRHATGLVMPEAIVGSLDTISLEKYHAMIVEVQCAWFEDPDERFDDSKFRLLDGQGGMTEMFVGWGHPLYNTSMPQNAVNIQAISSYEFKPRLYPLGDESFAPAQCVTMTLPKPVEINSSSITFTWSSSESGLTRYYWGLDPDSLNGFNLGATPVTSHSTIVFDLEPAQVVYFQAAALTSEGEVKGPVRPFITRSNSTSEVEVFFNNEVNSSEQNLPDGDSFAELMDAIFELIESADKTIDVAMYNINRNDIVNALELALNRGVRVRYIAESQNSNSALDPLPDFPVLFRDGAGIMHNKFIIVDAEDPGNAQVWTGATNFTTGQLAIDPNNAVLVHDQALAKVFEIEFEEMWGGDMEFPNSLDARHGEAKYDNTPHIVRLNSRQVEVYFSPSDYTAKAIEKTLDAANHTVDVGLLLITDDRLTNALVAAQNRGVRTRGIYNDDEFSQDALEALEAGNVDMRDYPRANIFHHKYAIIDAPDRDPSAVITGSHNWSFSADNINDENTLIFHDPELASIFKNEFKSRWSEITTSVSLPQFVNWSIGPNPFNEYFEILSEESVVKAELKSIDGKVVTVAVIGNKAKTSGLASGLYTLSVNFANGSTGVAIVLKR